MTTHDKPFDHASVDAHQQPAVREVITLSNADRDCLLGLLDNPPAPTLDLCELMRCLR